MSLSAIVLISFVSVASSQTREPTGSEVQAKRLEDAFSTVQVLSRHVLLQDLSPELKRDCFSAVDALENPFEFSRPDFFGYGNENALLELARNLQDVCFRGPRSRLELYGLEHLAEVAKRSRTTSGEKLEAALSRLTGDLVRKSSDTQPSEKSESDVPLQTLEQMRLSLARCWNVGSLTTEALQTDVSVSFRIDELGRPDAQSIKLESFSGGSEPAARQAFEAARRAIIRCGAYGLDVPMGNYDLSFSPDGIRSASTN